MSESPQQSIPVCTLFNDGGSTDGGDIFTNDPNIDSSVQPELSTGDSRKLSEPKLCNVFADGATTDPVEDIFAKISEEKVAGNESESEKCVQPDVSADNSDGDANLLSAVTKTMRTSKSADSFIVEELVEPDVSASENLPTEAVSSSKQTPLDDNPSVSQPNQENQILKDPIIASPSFISVTSFSISPDVSESTTETSISDASMSNLTSEIGGLTIENVASNLAKAGDVPQPHAAVEQDELTSYESQVISGTESLFSHDPSGNQSGFFSTDEITGMDEDDPFAAALNSSVIDRRRDAWLPCEPTKSILMSCLTNQVAPDVEMEKTTRPGLSTSELLEDPVKQLVVKLTGSETVIPRENLTMDDVSQDRIGIQKLLESGNHRSAANLCSKLLALHGQGFGKATHFTKNTPETLQIWYYRIYLLIKLKLYEMAAMELAHFGNLDNPDMYYEFYPGMYLGRRGSMVPFEFRILHAEFPRHVEKPRESLRRLHLLFATCEKIIHGLQNGKTEMGDPLILEQADVESSISFWVTRKVNIMYCIGNTLIQLKDYVLAVKMYERILSYIPENVVDLHSGIGRLYLHIGDMRAAQQHFMTAEKKAENNTKDKEQLLLNRGFMYIGTNNWREAYSQFQAALDLQPHNIIAINNKAVCLLYLGKLKEAIGVLENGAAQENTREVLSKVPSINRHQMLVQGVIGNLSTLYELESSQFIVKKRGLFLKHIAQNCGDSFDTGCFKGI